MYGVQRVYDVWSIQGLRCMQYRGFKMYAVERVYGVLSIDGVLSIEGL